MSARKALGICYNDSVAEQRKLGWSDLASLGGVMVAMCGLVVTYLLNAQNLNQQRQMQEQESAQQVQTTNRANTRAAVLRMSELTGRLEFAFRTMFDSDTTDPGQREKDIGAYNTAREAMDEFAVTDAIEVPKSLSDFAGAMLDSVEKNQDAVAKQYRKFGSIPQSMQPLISQAEAIKDDLDAHTRTWLGAQ